MRGFLTTNGQEPAPFKNLKKNPGPPMPPLSRDLAITAILAAVYTVISLITSYAIGFLSHGMETLLLRSVFYVILLRVTHRFGTGIIFGGVAGLLLELFVPSPVLFTIFPSLLVYGLLFDGGIRTHRQRASSRRIYGVTAVASSGMAITAMGVFTVVGFFPVAILPIIWTVGILRDITLGIIGVWLGLQLHDRINMSVL